ncbi:MAG: hypothetical protein WD801_05455 [Gemmatimonadaceae bacterium]
MKATTTFPVVAILIAACGDAGSGPSEPLGATVQVTVTTAGVHRDADGYTVIVGGLTLRVTGTISVTGLSAGDHVVELKDVAENCAVADPNPRTVTVAAGSSVGTTFEVNCVQVPLGLVYASNRTAASVFDIWSVRSDGTGPTVMITPGQGFLLGVSPDGSRIAFTSPRDGNPDVFIVNADGSDLRNLTQHPGTDVYPAFSPDGTRIAFMSSRDGTSDIFVMNADGSAPVNLTRSAGFENEPHWCGNRIAYTRSDAQGQADIYTMNADGSDVRRITHDNVITNTARWSPDCTRIAFASIRAAGPNGNPRNDLDLYAINADGTGLTRLTSTPGFDVAPTWSPDGQRIAFATERDGNSEIYIMNADGTGAFNLTGNPAANDQGPYWVR